MNHEEARSLLTDRLLDDLSAEDERRLEGHLEDCADCRATARLWSSAWDALGGLRPASIDPAAHVRFGQRLERERPSAWPRRPLLVAAAAALLLAGALVRHALAPTGTPGPSSVAPAPPSLSTTDEAARFLLLLRGDEPDRRRPAQDLVQEYGAWAASLAEAGSLISAAELEPGTSRWVAPAAESDPASTPVSGFFLVEAPTYDSAVAIARASPHAAYGGVVEVRRLAGER